MSQAFGKLIMFNEREYQRLSEKKRPVFVYEWLKNFEESLGVVSKADLKASQKELVDVLTKQLYGDCGPPTRQLLGRCFALLYHNGDQFSAFETVNTCSDLIKGKDDPNTNLSVKLAAMATIGTIFEKLGRMVGGSAPETVQILIKVMKNAESQGRCEILLCCQRILSGLGSAASSCHKDIFKSIRTALVDRSMAVRCAAAECAKELLKHASLTYTTELETLFSVCLKALEGSNYDVRVCISSLLGKLMAASQRPPEGSILVPSSSSKGKKTTMDEMFTIMASGFVRGGTGFGELLKTTVPQEVRVGVTQAYVVLFNEMGGTWVEKNIEHILTQVLELLSNQKATQSHVDAVYSRKCVSFVLRTMLGRLLGEKAQVIAGKELCKLVSRQMKKIKHVLQTGPSSSSADMDDVVLTTQHTIICALQELAGLIQDLSTAAGSLVSDQTIDTVLSVLGHPAPASRLSAAWCARTIAVAVPSHLTPLIDRCLGELSSSTSVETVTGYAYTLSALIGGVRHCPLGIPHLKGKLVFSIAEDMLKQTTEETKWAMPRAKCGWMIMGSLMTLGPSTVRHFLPKMLALWASAFPPTPDEAQAEKKKGDPYTWQVTLECRSGALAALSSFIACCPTLLTDDVIRRVMIPLETCVAMTAILPTIIKQQGNHLKVSAAMIRLRLYETFLLLPPKSHEGLFNTILRELVSEFTLTSNQSMTTTSLLRTMCHKDDSILLGTWLQETDHKSVEDQLQPNSASGSGALEHDYSCLFTYGEKSPEPPGPLPLGVAVIDASIKLFGQIFPHIAQKHRNQLLSHFATCIKSAKAAKAQAVTMNIFTAFLSALRAMGEAKSTFGDSDVRSTADNLVMSALNNADPILRCAAAEALGRMAQVVDEPAYVAQIAQSIFAKIQGSRDAISRTGHSIALGCLHRYVGGMGAGQHTQTSVSILLALAQDMSSSIVQVWALHALALIADCGGPMFRGYVDPTLEQSMSLLLSVPPSNTEIHQCIGKCLAALITSIGPELQDTSSSIKDLRSASLVAASVMQNHPDSLVQAEAIACLQQLHIFAPRHVNLSTLVPSLCTNLSSAHLILRRAAVACLRQLSQREAKDVCEHARACKTDDVAQSKSTYLVQIGDDGLEGALFGMLDTEVDRGLRSDIQDTLTSMLQTLAPEELSDWLTLCKSVLSAAKSGEQKKPHKGADNPDEDDESGGMGGFSKVEETHPTVSPRWPTRVFASESVQRIMTVCEQKRAHFDLALARELKRDTGKGDYLVMHLAELVRLAFIAATATSDQLKLEGLKTLQEIVRKFSSVQDPDYAGHVILEQFQAQVGAALRPAFETDTPADVTAMACEVCSTWIASGVSYDLNDVRRIQQLLVTSLSKFGTEQDSSSQLYNESANTMEKLAVLKAWAQVYIVAMKQQTTSSITTPSADQPPEPQEPLMSLVTSHIGNLSHYWLGALKDYGYLSLPTEYAPQLPNHGGMFYSPESMNQSRSYYQQSWPPILHAAALWLNDEGFANADQESKKLQSGVLPNAILSVPQPAKSPEDLNTDRFHLLLGLCVKALSSTRLTYSADIVTSCVHAVNCLLEAPWARNCLGADKMLSVELLNVLHRLLLTRDSLASHVVIMSTVARVVHGARDVYERASDDTLRENDVIAGQSVVFGALETCMCLLTRYFPALLSDSDHDAALPSPRLAAHSKGASQDFSEILSTTVSILSLVPDLCTSHAVCDVIPIVLRLITCIFEEAASYDVPLVAASNSEVNAPKMPSVVASTLRALKELLLSVRVKTLQHSDDYVNFFRCCLYTIIEATKNQESTHRIDDSSVVSVVALFVLSAPREVAAVAGLHEDCVQIFIRCIQSTDEKVQLKTIQTCSALFSCPDQSRIVGYIHSVGPHIVAVIQQTATVPPSSDLQVSVCQQAIDTVELLVGLAEETTRPQMLSLFLPLLVNLLLDQSTNATSFARKLHESAFQKLLSIAPKYPQPFKTIMASRSDLKLRLEGAVRANQAKSKAKTPSQAKPTTNQPKIKLKMDFSNFK